MLLQAFPAILVGMTDTISTTFNLDRQGFYPLTCHYDPAQQRVTLQFDHEKLQTATPRFRYNLLKRLSIDGNAGKADETTSTVTFEGVTAIPVTLAIAERHIATLKGENGALVAENVIPLSVSHKRIIGTYHGAKLQDFAIGQHYDPEKFAGDLQQATNSIIGDFHTHSSGNISARALLDVAIRRNARYPLHLLEDIGITITDTRKEGRVEQSTRIKFPPLEPQELPDEVDTIPLSLLTSEELLKLERSMAIRDTEIQTFAETEAPAYQMRYPLTKNPGLLQELIREMARENQRAGIRTIDLSYVGLEDPAIFRAVHEVLHDLKNQEDTKHVRVFLKYGIPRTHDIRKIEELLEKAKVIAKSPYVTSIDFLGYEDNKTKDFSKDVTRFAHWAKEHAPDLMIAVHAGENDKNHNNVKDALKLAKETGMRVRIGHGLYGVDDKTITLARSILDKDPLGVVFELNPESNIALNNSMDAKSLTNYRPLIDSGVPCVPGSDSFGQYQSSRIDLAQTFMDAGFTHEHFVKMENHQKTLVNQLKQRQHSLMAPLEQDFEGFITTACEDLGKIPSAQIRPRPRINNDAIKAYLESQNVAFIEKPKTLPSEFEGKKPVMLIGASGSSWERIDSDHQREIAIACDMLVHALDPKKIYFAQGRNKNSGLSEVLNRTISKVNNTTTSPYQNVGFQADIEMSEQEFPYSHLTHMIAIPKRTAIPDTLADFTTAHNGIMIAMGGAAYTRDALLKADLRSHEQEQGFVYTMNGPAGASSDKARGMGEKYVFTNGKELLKLVFREHRDYFKQGLDCNDEVTLDRLYKEAQSRIGDRYSIQKPQGGIVPNDLEHTPPDTRRHR
jgi:hypothetical protein